MTSRVLLEIASNVVPQVGQELMWEVWILSQVSTETLGDRDGCSCFTSRGIQKIKFNYVSDIPLNSTLCQRTDRRLTRCNMFALFWQNLPCFLTFPLTMPEMPSCNPKKSQQKTPKPKNQKPPKPKQNQKNNPKAQSTAHISTPIISCPMCPI